MTTATAAFVHDTSVFGATSPVSGQRSRFEVTPAFGSLDFTTAIADYRRYFMPAPFYTFATPRHALRPLRHRQHQHVAVSAVPRISRVRPRLRGRLDSRGRVRRRPGGRDVRGLRPDARIASAGRQSRAALPAAAAVRRAAAGCTGRCPSRWRSSPTAAWRGPPRSVRRSSAAIASRSRAPACRSA